MLVEGVERTTPYLSNRYVPPPQPTVSLYVNLHLLVYYYYDFLLLHVFV
jgi:hypothetical protein